MHPSKIAEQLRDLGLRRGAVVVVHTSYRAVRPVHGGPLGLIEALRMAVGDEGTIVMPSWGDDEDSPFNARATPTSGSLGVTSETFRHVAGAQRSDHPFAFVAQGPEAAAIVNDPLPIPPHEIRSPVGRVYDRDGQVLLLGVGHSEDTTIHLAEALADVPYAVPKHCTVMRNAVATRVDYYENDHCCMRFALADDWLRSRGLQREGPVGHAHARLVRSHDVVEVALEHLANDPLVFLHDPAAQCDECDAARASVGSGRG